MSTTQYSKKVKSAWIALILLAAPAAAWAGMGPRISFDQLTQNIGKIPYGQQATTSFSFVNKGDEPLIIKSVSADCGCTKALLGSRIIEPNAKGEVKASFDTDGLKAGKKQKHVYVASNDSNKPEVKLTLVAEVIKDLEADPSSVTKKLENFEETVSFPLKVTNSSVTQRTITGLKSMQGDYRVALKPQTLAVPPGQTVPCEIVINLSREAQRPIMLGKVMLETDHPSERELEIRYLIQIGKPK